jgi:hypothetical protein
VTCASTAGTMRTTASLLKIAESASNRQSGRQNRPKPRILHGRFVPGVFQGPELAGVNNPDPVSGLRRWPIGSRAGPVVPELGTETRGKPEDRIQKLLKTQQYQ